MAKFKLRHDGKTEEIDLPEFPLFTKASTLGIRVPKYTGYLTPFGTWFGDWCFYNDEWVEAYRLPKKDGQVCVVVSKSDDDFYTKDDFYPRRKINF